MQQFVLEIAHILFLKWSSKGEIAALKEMTAREHKTILRLIESACPLYLKDQPRVDINVVLNARHAYGLCMASST